MARVISLPAYSLSEDHDKRQSVRNRFYKVQHQIQRQMSLQIGKSCLAVADDELEQNQAQIVKSTSEDKNCCNRQSIAVNNVVLTSTVLAISFLGRRNVKDCSEQTEQAAGRIVAVVLMKLIQRDSSELFDFWNVALASLGERGWIGECHFDYLVSGENKKNMSRGSIRSCLRLKSVSK
jgi:hypothetical protein